MQKLLGLTLTATMIMAPVHSAMAAATDVVGTWVTPNAKSNVQIMKAGNKFVGKIISLKEPNRNGKPKMDAKNPKKALRSRPIKGMMILNGLTYKGGEWVGGTIYNPEDGKTYSCKMMLKNKNTLEVRGYVLGMPALGKSQVWKRK